DPYGFLPGFCEIYDLAGVEIAGIFAQDLDAVGRSILGHRVQPVTLLPQAVAKQLLIAAFEAEKPALHIAQLLPAGCTVASLDDIRVPGELLTNSGRYLDALNFATNFAFFRDDDGHHTRLVTANYWSGYGAQSLRLWAMLLDGEGHCLAE